MLNSYKILGFHEYLKKSLNIIFLSTAIVAILGNILDLLLLKDTSFIFLLNTATIVIILLALVLQYFFKIKVTYSYAIVVYAIIANSILSIIINLNSDSIDLLFARDILFLILLLVLASFVIHRIHALFIGGILILLSVLFTLIEDILFLEQNLIIIVVSISSFSILQYYFVGVLRDAIEEHQKQSNIVNEQNDNLNEINILLKEQSNKIINQSRKLNVANEELKTLNSTKNKFFSILSHDLKNPCGIINDFLGLLIESYDRLSDERKKMYLQKLKETATSTYELLENLLKWSRSQSKDIQFAPKKIHLYDIIENIHKFLHANLEKKELKFMSNIKENCIVHADNDMLTLILRNLISNAIKFTPFGGEIKVDVTKVNREFLKISVSDNGIGIKSDDIEKLFRIEESFTTPGTEDEKGSGLGLILCKEFVEKHRGEIGVKSVFEKGTTIWFTIPLK